jgi:hypothetical protein
MAAGRIFGLAGLVVVVFLVVVRPKEKGRGLRHGPDPASALAD